jgi:hypothetical protein
METNSKFTLLQKGDYYVLKLDNEEGTEKMWLDEKELKQLKEFLETVSVVGVDKPE